MSSASEEREDNSIYKVVVNHEEQYSIWPADRENALGWSDAGKSGPKEECLAYIKEVWTDMRPLSLRKHMEEDAQTRELSQLEPSAGSGDGGAGQEEVVDLVRQLSSGSHPLEASLRPEKTPQAFKESIERGYVFLKFTGTRGGTELGVRLDPQGVDFSQADFDNQRGTVHLEGSLTLNYVKVRCLADVDLETLSGQGRLEPVTV
jgi:uncharacterized protein YbdZ (MbtH family)